jgi:SAM-dependent methyltransferase
MLACPRTRAPYEADVVRESDDEIVEAFLVPGSGRLEGSLHEVRPIFAGVAVLPVDLDRHLRDHGSVYRRSPINDPRLARFLLGRAGAGHDAVPFDLVVGHYRDLAHAPPEGYDTTVHPSDAALDRLLVACLGEARRAGRGLEVGCGVGRGTFLLCARLEAALGVDRSVACVRRARNIAVTREHFFLPAPRDSGLKEIPLDLDRIAREGADFAVADAHALPVADGAADVVVLHAGDAKGAWSDAAAVAAEARRVLAPGGLWVWHDAVDPQVGLAAEAQEPPFRARRVDA